jgi:endogenous inhibitor of DNA gyrase (YacG/DUF329 family)
MSLKLTCPGCRKPMQVARTAELPEFPFCSVQCRDGDTGRWMLEAYQIVEDTGRDPMLEPSLNDLLDGDV